ncbi:hypothetical protein HPG69_017044 [Diceros bicornis minor]|uniref:Chemokine interleukin-8-like domain-containing protein n=1 Tax=Diceros bicornis minor TaxID=77932 RepID=A0A7J7EDE4_DICBM|nr:hypothetical protein HPG69_017044 [Diceros bicornis minor]
MRIRKAVPLSSFCTVQWSWGTGRGRVLESGCAMSHRVVLHINELACGEGRSRFKRGPGGRREAVEKARSRTQSAAQRQPRGTHRRAQREPVGPAGALRAERGEPGGVSGPPHGLAGALPESLFPRRAPPASMRLLTAALLLLLLALCAARVDGSKCKCSRKGPKIRYSDVKKLEMKPKYPHCEEKMVIITTKSVSRYRGQEHCLHPKLQSTKRFIKWYNAWNEKRRQLTRQKQDLSRPLSITLQALCHQKWDEANPGAVHGGGENTFIQLLGETQAFGARCPSPSTRGAASMKRRQAWAHAATLFTSANANDEGSEGTSCTSRRHFITK